MRDKLSKNSAINVCNKNQLRGPKITASGDDKIKIALVSQEYSKTCAGGVCRYTYILAHGLADLGNEVHVVSMSDRGEEYDCDDGNVHVHRISPKKVEGLELPEGMEVSRKNLEYSYAVCLKLFELVQVYGVQIVDSVSWDAEAFVYSLYKPVPLVLRVVTPLFKLLESQEWEVTKDKKLAHWTEGEAARRADTVIAISDAIGKLFQEHHRVQENKVILSPLGCELPNGIAFGDNKGDGRVNVLFVGRLERRKGIDVLFNAIPAIIDANPNVYFWIAGKDTNCAPDGRSFKLYLSDHLGKKYVPHVKFFDFVPETELKELYRTCDIFVAPSLYESFGQIYIEAMAWGKPVIGCSVGGVPEVIQDNVTGIVVPPENSGEIASAILKLTDPDLRVKMGSKGRESVEKYFSIENFVNSALRIYRDVITQRKCPNDLKVVSMDSVHLLRAEEIEEYKKQYERYTWSGDLINKYLDEGRLIEGKTCVDVGCGQGNMMLALKKYGAKRVTGIDIDLKTFNKSLYYTIALENGIDMDGSVFIEGDLKSLAQSPGDVDLVTMHDVIEHVSDVEGLIADIGKILKKGGLLFISTSPLFYSPIGHHCWYIYSREKYPWVHLYDDDFLTYVKSVNPGAADRYLELNKITVDDIVEIAGSNGFKVEKLNLQFAGEKVEDHPNRSILRSLVKSEKDLNIEGIKVLMKKV